MLDLEGKTFGRLLVVEFSHIAKDHRSMWKCKCTCGNTCIISGHSLKSGHTKSCGCLAKENRAKGAVKSMLVDLTGEKFGRLVAEKYLGNQIYLCKCDCGNHVEVLRTNLKSGATSSCGCIRKEAVAKLKYSHGMCGERIYQTWQNMKSRCLCKNSSEYKNYGGRGITVCNDWLDFNPFYDWAINSGYNDNLTIERIDVNGNYEPSNCKWIPSEEQCLNKTNTRRITINGNTKSLSEWAKYYGIPYDILRHRIDKGISPEIAVATPLKGANKKTNGTMGIS